MHFPVLSAVGVQGMEDYTIPGVETLQLYLLDMPMVQCTLTCTSLLEKFILVVFAVMTELLCEESSCYDVGLAVVTVAINKASLFPSIRVRGGGGE